MSRRTVASCLLTGCRLALLLLLPVAARAEWDPWHPDPLMEYHYSYDQVGNITRIEDGVKNSTSTFTYDEVNRLTSAIGPYGANGAQQTQTYSYDAVGNISGTPPLSTDGNGNITQLNGKTIEYDYENRPIKITDTSGTVTEFKYDYAGQRVLKKVTAAGATEKTFYVGNIYEVHYYSTTGVETQTIHIYAGSLRVASRVTDNVGSRTYYYIGDHLGSTRMMTDALGQVVQDITYEPWGSTVTESSTTYKADYKYTGQMLDDSTNLYYYGARYYDPQLRRFITPDSIVANPFNPQSLNRYAYVLNNPLTYVDPLGLWRISISFHAVFGFDLSYDSDNGHLKGGLGFGMGGGISVGDNNWDVGFSNDQYIDVGYDNKMKSAYVTAQYGNGWQGPNGTSSGWGVSGTYYFRQSEYQVGGGVGIGNYGVNAGYSKSGGFGLGVSGYGLGTTYGFKEKKFNYSVNPMPWIEAAKKADEISDMKHEEYPHAAPHRDDALRHAEWAYLVAEKIGYLYSWAFGIGHEIKNLIVDNATWSDIFMDLHNNAVGRAGAKAGALDADKLRLSPTDPTKVGIFY